MEIEAEVLGTNLGNLYPGVIARCSGTGSYYMLRLVKDGVHFSKVGGKSLTAVTHKMAVAANQWYGLKLSVKNNEAGHAVIKGYCNGELIIETEDTSPLAEGYAGFRNSWAQVAYANFRFKSLEDGAVLSADENPAIPVKISWANTGMEGSGSYQLYRSEEAGEKGEAVYSGTEKSFQDESVKAGKGYYYRLGYTWECGAKADWPKALAVTAAGGVSEDIAFRAEQAAKDAIAAKQAAEAAETAAKEAAGKSQAAEKEAKEAQQKAEDAAAKAKTAQTAAEEAKAAAESAKALANADKEAADAAAERAKTAEAAAVQAKKDAETAKTTAGQAAAAAEMAKGEAETAKTAAETARNEAQTAQTAAETAKGLAEQFAGAAELSKEEAVQAKQKAEEALSQAKAAKEAAETASGTAATAKEAAEAARTAAETAKSQADAYAQSAAAQTGLAQMAAETAHLSAERAETAEKNALETEQRIKKALEEAELALKKAQEEADKKSSELQALLNSQAAANEQLSQMQTKLKAQLAKESFRNSKVRLSSVKGQKKKVKLSWKPVEGADGYVVEYGQKANLKGAKKITVKGKTSKTLTGLKSGKTYYVRVKDDK